ncbi:uncharacterized protein DUF4446 [Fusobacterium naviforme]|uniref:DUF4446 domain-containing protein n=1 Tax=Moryella indoligenes TaxID=371674 RepID=A0AAE4ALK2_9FIRM|nr:DUF4446 family protein [Moryella indoligenes]KAB0578291.1 DUF4446 family protein [Fusobacterium naviforme]MDQ0152261.1 hypothetical protein [Moryella indoligenes]PSL10995.1 uncharacterized protein DUF4446 [Fusobacterium naviforme]STO28368.1 Uncharacterised protein [Fusobacterium naviforme]
MQNWLLILGMAGEGILLILGLLLYLKYRKLYHAYDLFMRGKDAESLEDTVIALGEEIRDLRAEDRANKDAIRVLNKNQRASFQKFGIVRYNAFKDMGGNMSFAIAELDYTNSGFIINTVHSREGCYLYIKTVDCGQTEILLSAEEKEALEQALGYLNR